MALPEVQTNFYGYFLGFGRSLLGRIGSWRRAGAAFELFGARIYLEL